MERYQGKSGLRMFHGCLRGEGAGRVVRPREARVRLLITNYTVIIGAMAIVQEF